MRSFKKCLEGIIELNRVDDIYLYIDSKICKFDHVKFDDLTIGELTTFFDYYFDMKVEGCNVYLKEGK